MGSSIQRKAVDSVNIDDRRRAARTATADLYNALKKMEDVGLSERPDDALAADITAFYRSWVREKKSGKGWIALAASIAFFLFFSRFFGFPEFTGRPLIDGIIGVAVFYGLFFALWYSGELDETRKSRYITVMLGEGRSIKNKEKYVAEIRRFAFGPENEIREDVYRWPLAVFLFSIPAIFAIAAVAAETDEIAKALAGTGAFFFLFFAAFGSFWKEVTVEQLDDEEIEDEEKEDSNDENYDFEQ